MLRLVSLVEGYSYEMVLTDCIKLVGQPLIDDNALYTYFHNRYQVGWPESKGNIINWLIELT